MTLKEFRENKRMVRAMHKAMAQPPLKQAIRCLWESHPMHSPLPLGACSDARASRADQTEGYNLCLRNLLAMGTLASEQVELTATYAPPEEDL
jgi:hypothetical protein